MFETKVIGQKWYVFLKWYAYGVEEYQKKSFQHMDTFFMLNWFEDCKHMQEIEFPQLLLELSAA